MQAVVNVTGYIKRDHGKTYPIKDFLPWFTSPSAILAVINGNRGYKEGRLNELSGVEWSG